MNRSTLVIIAKGTKRKKREIGLLELSDLIKSEYERHNSLNGVAKLVKLSSEMVREFLKITELEEGVKDLIRQGLIGGVDMCYRISKLKGSDQIILAKSVVEKNLSSDDVRSIVGFKIDNPSIKIEKVISKVIQAKDRKIYVAYLGIEKDLFEKLSNRIKKKDCARVIQSIFQRVIPKKFIVSFELNGRVIVFKILQDGLQSLRRKASDLKVPLPKLADALLKGYLKETNI